MKIRVTAFITVLIFALIMGLFWGTWFSISRSIASISPGTFIEGGTIIANNLSPTMHILMPGAILFSLLNLIFVDRKRMFSFYWFLLGGILMLTAIIITLKVNVPIDNQIKMWSLSSMPVDWMQIRDHWEVFQTLRTFLSMASFVAVILGVLNLEKDAVA